MKEVRDATAKIMDSTSLADMLNYVESVVNGKEPLSFAI
jgi:DNA-binding IscR family transcriptional regulator